MCINLLPLEHLFKLKTWFICPLATTTFVQNMSEKMHDKFGFNEKAGNHGYFREKSMTFLNETSHS
jgi:hypothetical protein